MITGGLSSGRETMAITIVIVLRRKSATVSFVQGLMPHAVSM